ncbi:MULTISPECIES: hypothetical protein [Micromonospora]|nr:MULTISPECIES: hypothetical protein [unclassified Micromonospora]MDG4756200.1 hypothetical protein [Micromonospora sp. WMMD718]
MVSQPPLNVEACRTRADGRHAAGRRSDQLAVQHLPSRAGART